MHEKPWLWAVLVTAGAGLALALLELLLDASVWSRMEVPDGTVTYFCERTRSGDFIRQPANTFTNLSYLFVAVLMVAHTRRAVLRGGGRQAFSRRPSFLHRFPQYGYLYALCLAYTFLGSSLFHASLGLLPEQVDLSAVYATGAVPLAFALHKSLLMRRVHLPVGLFAGAIVLWSIVATVFAMDMRAHIAFPVMLLLAGIFVADIEIRKAARTSWKWLGPLFGCVVASGLFFVADIQRIGCMPDGFLHPHGLWHIGAAGAAACMYGYMLETEE